MTASHEEVEEFFEAIECDDEDLVKAMVEKDKSLLDQHFEGAQYEEELKTLAIELLGKNIGSLTPLQYACFVESEDAALALIDLCTPEQLSRRWGDNNDVVHLAAFNGMEAVLGKLLRKGMPSTIMNKSGFRPMDCVANDDTRDVFVNFRNEEDNEDKPKIPVAKTKKMIDLTEMPSEKKAPNPNPNPNLPEESLDDLNSEYEVPEYPPMRTIDPNLKPSKPTIKNSTTAKNKKDKSKVKFEQEPTYFDSVKNGELDLVKHFIQDLKMNPNAQTYLGISVLHMSVESENLEVVSFLVDSGAKVNVVDADGWSPFHLACSLGNLDVVKYLIEKGSNINAPTKEGEYALELTESEEIKDFIRKYEGFDQSILQIIASRPKVEEDDEKSENKKLRKKMAAGY